MQAPNMLCSPAAPVCHSFSKSVCGVHAHVHRLPQKTMQLTHMVHSRERLITSRQQQRAVQALHLTSTAGGQSCALEALSASRGAVALTATGEHPGPQKARLFLQSRQSIAVQCAPEGLGVACGGPAVPAAGEPGSADC